MSNLTGRERAIRIAACILGAWISGYLVGAFIAASFDITDWQVVGRGMTAMIATVLGVIGGIEWSAQP